MSAGHSTTVPTVGVIITAGGSSSRFGSDKLSARLGESSVLARSIAAFIGRADVTEILVAISPAVSADSEFAREIESIQRQHGHGHVHFVRAGGASRAQTVANAVAALLKGSDFVVIHDGARPLVSKDLIDRVIAAAVESGAAAPAVPVTSTIKQGGAALPTRVERTVPRAELWAMQTPQVIRRSMFIDAIARCPLPLDQVTDDVQLIELCGQPVTLVAGDERNLKITTSIDLHLARLLLQSSLI